MASPSRKAADLRAAGGAHKENIAGKGAGQQLGTNSPGKLPAARFSVTHDSQSYIFGSEGKTCESCGAMNRRGDGTACSCGHVASSARFQSVAGQLRFELSTADRTAEAKSNHMSDFVTMLREGAGANQRHRGGSTAAGGVINPRAATGAGGNNSTSARNGARAGLSSGGPAQWRWWQPSRR